MHGVAEDRRPALVLHGLPEHGGKIGAVKHIVAEDEADAVITNEFLADDESVGQAAGTILRLVAELDAQA